MDERFSAVLDDEASIDEIESVIGAVLADENARDCWTRQYQLKAILQADITSQVVDDGFADRVMAALDAEEQVPADNTPITSTQQSPRAVSLLATRQRRRNRRSGGRTMGWRTGFGAAAAASIVGVVVFAYTPFGTQNHATGQSQQTAVTSSPTQATGNAYSGATRSVADTTPRQSGNQMRQRIQGRETQDGRWSVSDPALRRELNGYLVQHNGLARNFGLSASTPTFVHAATYRTQTTR